MAEQPLLIHLLVNTRQHDPKGMLSRIEDKLDRLLLLADNLERRVAKLETRVIQLEKPPGRD